MKRKILIANRGEIAVRIIRAAKELGYKTCAVYSEADKTSAHRFLADESVCIGPANPAKSYLNIHNIISAAKVFEADAIHPGYGFLAENADFARLCEKNNINFIGPSAELIEIMGDKNQGKIRAKQYGVPLIEGTSVAKSSKDIDKVVKEANKIGYPLIVKASYGGGGKGMRIIRSKKEVERNLRIAMEESSKAFDAPDVYLEKYIENPKHIEVQILGDKRNNIIHLLDRDCSMQRNHQKMIEEAVSPTLNQHDRNRLHNYALKIAKGVKYYSAGTIEFLMDNDKNFYFIEMNTRIQVEHPVSEQVTDTDILKEQIEIAFGKTLSIKQKDIEIKNHSIEFRINAENPDFNFAPSSGTIEALYIPGGKGIRVDTHVFAGYEIPEYYDSMIAKLIVSAPTRDDVLNKARVALSEFSIEGIDTNIDFYLSLLDNKTFKNGTYTTGFFNTII